MDSWKKAEEAEIDLTGLLHRLCVQWKQAAACAVAATILLGGFEWIQNKGETARQEEEAAEAVDLTQQEQKEVEDALVLAAETGGLEQYMEDSVLMKIDPYHKNTVVTLYSIEDAQRKELAKIVEGYLLFLTKGGAAEAFLKGVAEDGGEKLRWQGMDKRCLSELILAWQKSDGTYQVAMDETSGSVPAQALLYVEVSGKDGQMAREAADGIQKVLMEFAKDMEKSCGKHKLAVVGSRENTAVDTSLQAQQREKRSLLDSDQSKLKGMVDVFSKEQKAVYEKEAGMEEDAAPDGDESQDGGRVSLKYILLGFLGGIFGYCSVYALWYVSSDTVKSGWEIQTYYTFPFYGNIKKGRAQVLNRLKLACGQQGLTKICLAADVPLDAKERGDLEDMAVQLQKWGIFAQVVEDVMEDVSAWGTIADAQGILMVCKTGCRHGCTTRRMVDKEMGFYMEHGAVVVGAAETGHV